MPCGSLSDQDLIDVISQSSVLRPLLLFQIFINIFSLLATKSQICKYDDDFYDSICSEAATRGVFCEKVFLEISQNSQENTSASVSFFNKVAGLRPATLLKKRLWHRCFPVNLAKLLRTPFSQTTYERLPLLCSCAKGTLMQI